MKAFLFLVLVLISALARAQSDYLEVAFKASTFNKQELKDSAYRQVRVLRYAYSYNQTSERVDTVYEAKFDSWGNPTYEKVFKSGDSLIFIHYYKDSNTVHKTEEQYWFRNDDNRYNTRIWLYEDGKIKQEEEWYGNQWGSTTLYFYGLRSQLVSLTYLNKDSFHINSLYTYDKHDRLVGRKDIESFGKVKDSLMYGTVYDSKGRVLEDWKRPSKTYYKKMALSCAEGLSYYNRYKYNALGRKVFESEFSEEALKNHISYAGRAYKRIQYYDNGFIERWYDSKDQLKETNVYNFYESRDYTGHYLRESYNHTTKLTSFLSENSKLPTSVDYGRYDSKATYIIEYYK
jgi:hypothetical protein